MRRIPFIAAALGVFMLGITFGRLGVAWLQPPPANMVAEAEAPESEPGPAQARPAETAEAASQPKDFETRFDRLLATGNPFERARAVLTVAEGLSIPEVQAALARVERYHGSDRNKLLTQLASRWAELDGPAAWNWASEAKEYEARSAVLETWARSDPRAVEERIANTQDDAMKTALLTGLIQGVAESDPKRAFAIYQQNSDRLGPWGANLLFQAWAERDPESAAEAAAALPLGRPERFHALSAVADKWGETNPSRALAWAESAGIPNAPWASAGRVDPSLTSGLLASWMDEDSEAAKRWLEQLPDGGRKRDLLETLCQKVSEDDPRLGVELVKMLPAGSEKDKAAFAVAQRWAWSGDLAGAVAWAQQGDDQLRRATLPVLVSNMAASDIQGALALAQSIGGGKEEEQSVRWVARQWSRQDPAATAAWAATQPQSTKYWNDIARNWVQKDSTAAGQWMASLPDGPQKDDAFGTVAQVLSYGEKPESAADWIAQIGDEQKRSSAYEALAHQWISTAPNAARAWIESSSMPPEVKAKLLPAATQ